ncbi:protein CHUP1, chloroplastic-like isoform X1 [Vigna unguiculata]|uniref:protein CHUP1, chloroplastic-like isoform X1 n=1 Tax=Vigna unguiculata TaxID=3917 RepID=UPI0010160A68|nr:protein CHUP1, chloroplastic-like isoform X1 [Vigna unguiculata]
MIVRLGVIVAASIAALTVKQLNVNNSRSEHGEARFRKSQDEGTEQEQVTHSTDGLTTKIRQEEDQKEVMLISSVTNRTDDFEDDISPELESLLSGEIDFPLLADRTDEERKDKVYETDMANNASELERLRNLVRELEEREVKLEGELLEYYGLKEQEADFVELQRQLNIKTVEIDMLKMTINSLQEERKKLQEELTHGASAKRELEAARSKIKELRRQIQLEANQAKTQLLLLKQKVSSLVMKEEEVVKKDAEIGKKLKALNDLEVEVVELKRENKELQHEKREVTVKLNAAESRITELSNENEMLSKVKEEVSSLRHMNEDLLKQVEGLQINRFSEVEELVYLRWVNACLRYELKNYQAPPGKLSTRDLNTSLSPKSQEKAKQLMLEYAGSEHGQGDTDIDSYFSHTSSPGSEDFDNASSIDSFMSKHSSVSKKTSLIQKLKKWGKSKDDSSALSSPARYLSGGSLSRMNMSNRPRNSLESLMQRNAGDSVAITTFGQNDQEPSNSPETLALPSIRRVSSCESLNSVASSFQLMSKTVAGYLDGKYPAYKDRHKLALEREKQIKEKAEKVRVQKFGGNSNLNMSKAERERTMSFPSKLAQLKEKTHVCGSSNDHPDYAKNVDSQTISKMNLVHIEKRAPRVPQPPPKPSDGAPICTNSNSSNAVSCPPSESLPPPPPPAPPGGPLPTPLGNLSRGALASDNVHRFPELVEFYQTLMKREEKNETSSLFSSTTYASDARSNMIGEIENRSSFLLAVKADVETQGDFVLSLANEVRAASFNKIEDLVAFVNWLDGELSFLVDERAVLKHFDWPEGKTDVLREAAFEYMDLMKLEKQVSTFTDDPKHPCEVALQKMYSLLEKVEQSVYALLRTRDMAISRFKEFGIPVTWLLDTGVMGKIKLSSVQLANKYMKRVASELDILSGPDKEPNREFLIVQGVRFAFRVHQFAGGFDTESMKAFEELRSRIHAPAGEDSSNQKHK